MRKSHLNDGFLVLLGPIISRLFTCSNEEKKGACSSPISMSLPHWGWLVEQKLMLTKLQLWVQTNFETNHVFNLATLYCATSIWLRFEQTHHSFFGGIKSKWSELNLAWLYLSEGGKNSSWYKMIFLCGILKVVNFRKSFFFWRF